MKERVNILLNKNDTEDNLKYLIYSAHDTQLANALEILNPVNFTLFTVPFCSTIYFELHYTDECIENRNTTCFTV